MKSGELRTPILQALKTLGAINGTMASYPDVQAEVLKTLGKPDIHFLGNDARGKPTFAKVMANCAFALKSRGCIAQERKGWWTLTEAGQAVLDGGALPPLLNISGVSEKPRHIDWHARAMDAERRVADLEAEREADDATSPTVQILRAELRKAEDALADARSEQRKAEDESARLRSELDVARSVVDCAQDYIEAMERAQMTKSYSDADDALGELGEAVQRYESAYPAD